MRYMKNRIYLLGLNVLSVISFFTFKFKYEVIKISKL